ncbi:hypothetical protein RFI_23652 [Reticulomyxa filosa]|uniref:Uncharacterized protein n=1 Tax=Reticulomyxa filosa TaxID=46433 RepID=X6MIK6_RETFI|nr:hypothetical protein RFI_23652 [Reticulomyxa filosa]|eukprot:ETO13719.1 hypothetical protein RFI_23652 [Reticulomyxa filosa]
MGGNSRRARKAVVETSRKSVEEVVESKLQNIRYQNIIIHSKFVGMMVFMGYLILAYGIYHSCKDIYGHFIALEAQDEHTRHSHSPKVLLKDPIWGVVVHVLTGISSYYTRNYMTEYPNLLKCGIYLKYSAVFCFLELVIGFGHTFPMGFLYLIFCLAVVHFIDDTTKQLNKVTDELPGKKVQ